MSPARRIRNYLSRSEISLWQKMHKGLIKFTVYSQKYKQKNRYKRSLRNINEEYKITLAADQ